MLGYQRNTAQAYKKYAKECAKRMTNNTLRYRLIHYINKELHQYYRQQQMIAPRVRLVVAGGNVAPSPKGEGWDEGKYKCLILFSSPQPSPAGAGAEYHCNELF